MVVHNSSMLVVMAIAGTIATRLAQSTPSDATQFLVEVTQVSNLLCIFVTPVRCDLHQDRVSTYDIRKIC